MKPKPFIPIGLALGVAIGAAGGVATDNLALWLGAGIAIGVGLGGIAMIIARKKPD